METAEVAGIERTFATHGDCIRDSDGIVQPGKHALLLDGIFDDLAKVQH